MYNEVLNTRNYTEIRVTCKKSQTYLFDKFLHITHEDEKLDEVIMVGTFNNVPAPLQAILMQNHDTIRMELHRSSSDYSSREGNG